MRRTAYYTLRDSLGITVGDIYNGEFVPHTEMYESQAWSRALEVAKERNLAEVAIVKNVDLSVAEVARVVRTESGEYELNRIGE